MITFVVKGNKARTSPDFILKDLPGSGGRIDILCRCLTTSLLLSHGIRRNVEVILCLAGEPDPPKCIRVRGDEVKHLSPDERSTAIILKKALQAFEPGKEIESTPGVYISGESFLEILDKNSERLVLLDENGNYPENVQMNNDPCFIMGDHLGLTETEEKILSSVKKRLKLSPMKLHASHCIVLVHNMLDKMSEK